MASPVSRNNMKSYNQGVAQSSRQTKKQTSSGISTAPSSMQPASSSQIKLNGSMINRVFHFITYPIVYALKCVNKMFLSIYRLFFPKKNLMLEKKEKLSALELEAETADSLSNELILKKALDKPVTFTRLGEYLVKNKYCFVSRGLFYLERLLGLTDYYKLGKTHGTKHPAALRPHYRETCNVEADRLRQKIR